MLRKYSGWIVFGTFMILMVLSAISFAHFAFGQGDSKIFAAASALGIFSSLFFGMVKTPKWFSDTMNW